LSQLPDFPFIKPQSLVNILAFIRPADEGLIKFLNVLEKKEFEVRGLTRATLCIKIGDVTLALKSLKA
jgi:hypothetical protein